MQSVDIMWSMKKLLILFKKILSDCSKYLGSFSANFFQCFLGKILVRSCGLITLPLLTFYFSREEMGIYQLFLGGLGIFVEVATLGTRQYFAVEYFKYSSLYPRLSLVNKNVWINLKYTSVIFLLALLVVLNFFDKSYFGIFILFLFQSYLNIFNEMFLMFLQLQMKFTRYNLISFLFAATQTSLVVLAIVVLKFKLAGLALVLLFAELLFLAYFAVSSQRALRLISKMNTMSNRKLFGLLKHSWLFVPSTISFWLLVNIDQWMLGGMTNLENVGLYAFAGKFPLFFDFLLSSTFIFVYTPVIYKGLKDNFVRAGNRNAKLSIAVFMCSGLIYGISILMTPYLKMFIAENFYASLVYIPPLVFVACIRLASHLLQLTIKYKGQIAFILWSNILTAVLNTIFNYLWIPVYGVNGCVMATALSFVCMFAVNLVYHQFLVRVVEREEKVRYAA